MANKNNKSGNIGKTKRSTDDLIDNAIAKQNSWLENRRTFTRSFLKSLNVFTHKQTVENQSVDTAAVETARARRSGLAAYWFPILCAVAVVCIAVWVAFVKTNRTHVAIAPAVPEPVIQKVPASAKKTVPEFDIVRIDRGGMIVVAGRWLPSKGVSVVINNKIVATERTDVSGEFVYAPTRPLQPGNYTVELRGVFPSTKSADKVFLYVSDHGYENSISLLMTRDGSTLLQAPTMLRDGDLAVTKIDYLDTGRIVVTGDAMPRLRVSLTLDGKYLGFARVSDYRHFGLGADVPALVPGHEYSLAVRLHDGDGRTVSTVTHTFVMPEMTGDDDTFYTVRRGDCLWVIARNFLRRGILFSIIAERNNIENPDLIFPRQVLQIPSVK